MSDLNRPPQVTDPNFNQWIFELWKRVVQATSWSSITGTPNTLSGYGITDATTSSSGTYTPTLTNGTNVDASTAYACQWMRVGNTVTVSGVFDVDATAAGAWDIGVSLPVASNFSATENAGGTAVMINTASVYGYAGVTADSANDRLKVAGITTGSTGSEKFSFTATYQVI